MNRLYLEVNKVTTHCWEKKLTKKYTYWEIQFFDDYESHSIELPKDFFKGITSKENFYQKLIKYTLENSFEFSQMIESHNIPGIYVCDEFIHLSTFRDKT